MIEKITIVKNRVTAVMKKYKWSTDRAIEEACSGWKEIPCIKVSSFAIALSSHVHSHSRRPVRVVSFTTKHHEHEDSQNQDGKEARRAHDVHNDEPVFPGHRIVLVAVQQRMVGGSADFSVRRLDQSETKIPSRIRDSIKVASDAPVRREHQDRGRMGVLPARGIVRIVKAGRLRERVNRGLLARQKVPIFRGARPAVLARVDVAFRLRQRGHVFRLETDRDRVKVLAEVERNRLHRAQLSVEDFRAQRGTIEIYE